VPFDKYGEAFPVCQYRLTAPLSSSSAHALHARHVSRKYGTFPGKTEDSFICRDSCGCEASPHCGQVCVGVVIMISVR
jgi:hypothetical protein